MTKFFITHSWQDIEFARRLFNDLTAHGLEGWLDDATMQGGHRLAEQINKGLEWCDVYIPILSRAALESSWCWEEINAAIALFNKKKRQGRPRIVSILIEDDEEELPAVLAARLYFNFANRYDVALNELLIKGFGVTLPSATAKAAPPEIPTPPVSETAPAKVRVPSKRKDASPSPPKIETVPRTRVNPKDGKDMIFIPAGEFLLGSNEADGEKPLHKVYLDAFYIARYPVTNAEYRKFVDATRHSPPEHWKGGKIPQGKENHPVVNMAWMDAVAYCAWAGGRLPTEAEWEKAASWDDAKKEKRVYPWGKDFDKNKCNSSESGNGDTTPVGKYSPQGDSAYCVSDMAGNVWEWCSTLYQEYPYRADDGREDMDSGDPRVLRGGAWHNRSGDVRATYRHGLGSNFRLGYYGFRVVVRSL